MVPSNIVLDGGPGPPREGGFRVSEPPVCSDTTCRQIVLVLVRKGVLPVKKLSPGFLVRLGNPA